MKTVKSTAALRPSGTVIAYLGAGIAPTLSIPPSLHQAARERDLDAEALYLAWEITRCAQGLSTREQEALLYLVLCNIISVREGNTCLPIDNGSDYLGDLFESLGAGDELLPVAMEILSGIRSGQEGCKAEEVLGRRGDYRPLILDGNYLYHQRVLHQEEQVAVSLRARLAGSAKSISADQIDTAVQSVLAQPPHIDTTPMNLSDEQVQAVRNALTRPLSIISGGPGTGKTSVVVSILRVLARLGVAMESVALAAPTGKAANRMEASVQNGLVAIPNRGETDGEILQHLPRRQTLHRLLGYSSRIGGFRHHENNPLAYEVVIVDEASMIDLDLMDRLLRATPKEARLILLGDADQLPSVDAGAVFRDLVTPEESSGEGDRLHQASVRLTGNYRMDAEDSYGRNILLVASHINAGRGEAVLEAVTERANMAEVTYKGVELISEGRTPQTKRDFLEDWFTNRVVNHSSFEELASRKYDYHNGFDESDTKAFGQISSTPIATESSVSPAVTPTTSTQSSTKVAARALPNPQVRTSRPRFHPGEPILMLRNDYDRGLFNGDQGLVLNVATSTQRARPMAVFPRHEGYSVFNGGFGAGHSLLLRHDRAQESGLGV